jgi:hypothetical protein
VIYVTSLRFFCIETARPTMPWMQRHSANEPRPALSRYSLGLTPNPGTAIAVAFAGAKPISAISRKMAPVASEMTGPVTHPSNPPPVGDVSSYTKDATAARTPCVLSPLIPELDLGYTG